MDTPTSTSAANGDLADFFSENDGDGLTIEDDDVQIGRRITEARVALGDSVEVTAERIGVTATTIEEWESGASPIRANHLNKVAGVLGISLSWLIMGRGPDPIGDVTDLSSLRADLAAACSRLDDVINELAVLDQRLAQLDGA